MLQTLTVEGFEPQLCHAILPKEEKRPWFYRTFPDYFWQQGLSNVFLYRNKNYNNQGHLHKMFRFPMPGRTCVFPKVKKVYD